jgi:cytochrome c-type biogenesis protein CcmE
MKPGVLLGAGIIGICTLAAGYSLRGAVRPSLTVKEVMASAGEPCEVYGEVVKGATHYDLRAARLQFRLTDKTGDTIPIVFPKPKPANFDQASHVKAIGTYRDGAFQADNLILKCPSKYISNPPVPGKAGADKDPYAGLGKGA